MRLRLRGEKRSDRHDVWPTEINIKLRNRRKSEAMEKIPRKLLAKLREVEAV